MAHPKGVLIERLQKLGRGRPEFQSNTTGPDHEPTFLTDVVVKGEVLGTGQGKTKKDAERAAAEEALAALDRRSGGGSVEAVAEKPAPAAHDPALDGPFEGPWPIFESVLATALRVAHERTDPKLRGDDARDAIRDLALDLYKEVLEDLGEIVEVDS